MVDKGFYGNIESIIESVYYLEGNCEEEKIGELICREVSNFNNQGNLLKRSYINSKENFTENIQYEYDSQGYLIKEVSDDLEENLIL
ncbi:MAG: hypothetical protein IKB57_04495, partial [Bacteroidaceae bacterium]|nr:hypothetical protein [Bacteroidaceae bacterium]